jgi:16S rRNA (uracil1498-N3)-methyltransferase
MPYGARVIVCDGRGRQVEAQVQRFEEDRAVLEVVRELSAAGESPLAITLAIGLAKGDVLDAVMRQATEMGVSSIVPFTSRYSEKNASAREARRLDRWRRLAQEGLKSCQRAVLPEIRPVAAFAEVLPGPEEAKLIFWEEKRGGGLAECLTGPRPAGVRFLIGPEGGFAPEEAEQARAAGYQALSLGPRRLRVQTAALAALALVQFAWGDLA